MPLCSKCRQFDIQSFATATYQTRGLRLTTIQTGANDANCEFCRMLLQLLQPQIAVLKQPEDRLWVHLRMSSDDDGWRTTAWAAIAGKKNKHRPMQYNRLNAMLWTAELYDSSMSIEDVDNLEAGLELLFTYRVFGDVESAAVRSGDVKGVYLGDDPASEEYFEAIIEWLNKCLQHTRCCENASATQRIDAMSVELPTRCIELQPGGIKLSETSGQRGAYIILSHRWLPETKRSSTTARNIYDRLKSVDLDSLPQTFQDMIFVARRLGIPYVWIDSVCIVQDSYKGQDWEAEAKKMAQYYQNAVCTIAACDARNDGFLQHRPCGTQLVRLPYRNRDGRQDGYFYLQKLRKNAFDQYCADVQTAPLLQRGWVLQEWLLSRRILHYSADALFFECQTSPPMNEYRELAEIHGSLNRATAEALNLVKSSRLKRMFKGDETAPEELWRQIAEAYSRLELTKDSDRFVALSGVTSEVERRMHRSYQRDPDRTVRPLGVAGWWLHDLHYGLLWEILGRQQHLSAHCEAPSWSWLSFLGEVAWRSLSARMAKSCVLIRLLSANTFRTGRDDSSVPRDRLFAASEQLLGEGETNVALELMGKTELVLLGSHFSRYETQTIADFTAVEANVPTRWRTLSSPEDPLIHIGWASFDHLPETSLSSPSRPIVQALLVGTERGAGGGLEFGRLSATHDVYCVIFVTILPAIYSCPDRYQRVGVGRIFKQNFFRCSKTTRLWLG